jgi:hypothetical protein
MIKIVLKVECKITKSINCSITKSVLIVNIEYYNKQIQILRMKYNGFEKIKKIKIKSAFFMIY